MTQRLHAIVVGGAGLLFGLMLWVAATPVPAEPVRAVPPASRPSPTPRPAIALRLDPAGMRDLALSEAAAYTISLRLSNEGSAPARRVRLFLAWERRGDSVPPGWVDEIAELPAGALVTRTIVVQDRDLAGPGAYAFSLIVSGPETALGGGRELRDNRVSGVLTVLPAAYACPGEPNIRILTETLRLRNDLARVRVVNDGPAIAAGVVVEVAWDEGAHSTDRGVRRVELPPLRPCGGGAWALVPLGQPGANGETLLRSGSPVTVTARLPARPRGLPDEPALEDNQVVGRVR